MRPTELLGRSVPLVVLRVAGPGAFLTAPDELHAKAPRTILLPGAELPPSVAEGDELDVFVYLDSEGRPIATRRTPKLALGEVAFLTVTGITAFGAFVDWGLPKELLVPFAEQTTDLALGDRHPIGLYVDGSGRLAGTMRVREMLGVERARFEVDEWVEGEAWRNDPELGLFVILERAFVGLVPASEPHALRRGEAARFRVSHVHLDGKVELSLRGLAHEELEADARRILDVIGRRGAPRIGDRSPPDQIRALLGLSKKAFKRAAGRLLKDGAVTIDANGFIVPSPTPR